MKKIYCSRQKLQDVPERWPGGSVNQGIRGKLKLVQEQTEVDAHIAVAKRFCPDLMI